MGRPGPDTPRPRGTPAPHDTHVCTHRAPQVGDCARDACSCCPHRPPRLTFSACGNCTRGMRVSGSVAMPASSTRICLTSRILRLAEAAQEQVQRMTSCWSSSNFRASHKTFLYLPGTLLVTPGPPCCRQLHPLAPATYETRSSLEKSSPLCSRVSKALISDEYGLGACRIRWCRVMLLGDRAQ